MRYIGLKGKLWTVFSKYIRIRDYILYKRCVSCGKYIHWSEGDAGHYVAAGRCGFGLLFDELNVSLQCKKCNNPEWTPDASVPFGFELDKRHGEGTAKKLWERRWDITKEYSEAEYKQKIEYYNEKIREFEEKYPDL